MPFIYQFIRNIAKVLSDFYFKSVYVIGKENIPLEGPIILSGNHSNQFIDPMMILTNCPREISFCMAYSSLQKPIIGTIGKIMKVIPVYRPDDNKYKGSGLIRFISNTEIRGINTLFLLESKKNKGRVISAVQVLRYDVQVISIDSDDKISIRDDERVFNDLKGVDHPYYFIPKTDNTIMFDEAYRLLQENRAICIFPEGTSHDRTTFIKFKAGVAIMALSAMAYHNSKPIKMIPTGLSYFNRNEFRSEMILEFGKPFEVQQELVEMYKTDKRKAVELLLNEIQLRMENVTLLCKSMTEHKCLQLILKIYIPENVQLTPDQHTELSKRFSKGYAKICDNPESKEIKLKTMRYMEELKSCGIEDSEVKLINFSYNWYIKKVIYSIILFHFLIILHCPLMIILCPFLFIIKRQVENERQIAVLKNPNKIEGLDIISSSRIMHFLTYLPIILLIWLIAFSLYTKFYFLFYFGIHCNYICLCIIGSCIFPFYAYCTARAMDVLTRYMSTIKTRFLYFCLPNSIDKIRVTREKMIVDLRRVIDKYLKQIDESYHNHRVLNLDLNKNIINISNDFKNINTRSHYYNQSDSIMKHPNERH